MTVWTQPPILRRVGLAVSLAALDFDGGGFFVGRAIGRTSDAIRRRRLLAVSLIVNLGLLATFKYFDFFSDSLAALLGSADVEADWVTLRIVLPVGVSFYTFQTLSYTIDVYRGDMKPTSDLLRNIAGSGDWRDTNLTDAGRYRGFERKTYQQSDDRIDKLRNGAFRDMAIGGIEEQALRGLITDALDRGIDVVLIEMPAMTPAIAAALAETDVDLDGFRASLEGVAHDFGVPLVRLPELNDRPELYADEYHMNLFGTETFTRVLAERLDELALNTDDRPCKP